MNTTTSATQATRIPLAAIVPSKTNPRKNFDKVALGELEASIRKHDVIQPILVRPNGSPETFELVAGERRFRAAKAAGLKDIPATVRALSDGEAIEIQVIENLQRSDLHPLEEAEGYEALMKCPRPNGEPYTADEIAAKVGKSRSYIYGRLKLTALSANGRKALYAGFIDPSRALLLARIPGVQLQDKALLEILNLKSIEDLEPGQDEDEEDFRPRPMSYRDAADHVQWQYTLQLKVAPFKTADAGLVPSAGACTTCPKRSGNQPELFADIESADVCTDPSCFAAKRDAHLEQLAKSAADKGKKVVSPNARGYLRLDDQVKGDPTWRKVRDLLGKADVEIVQMPVADEDTGKTSFVEVVKKSVATPILAEKIKAAREKAGYRSGPQRDYELERKVSREYRRRLFTHIVAAVPVEAGTAELKTLVGEVMRGDCNAELVAELLLPASKGKASERIKAALPKLDQSALIRLLLVLHLSRETEEWHGDEEVLEDSAKLYKVDARSIKANVEAELKTEPTKKGKKPTEPALAA